MVNRSMWPTMCSGAIALAATVACAGPAAEPTNEPAAKIVDAEPVREPVAPERLLALLRQNPTCCLLRVTIEDVRPVLIRTGLPLTKGVRSEYLRAHVDEVRSLPDRWRCRSVTEGHVVEAGAQIDIVNKPWDDIGVPVRTLPRGTTAWVLLEPPHTHGLMLVAADVAQPPR